VIYEQRFFPVSGYISKIYGYGRVSHKLQYDKGNSIPDQESRIKAYIEMRRLQPEHPFSSAEYAGILAEPNAQSAFSKEFGNRPAGSEIMKLMKPSDHLVIDRLDRLSRNTADFLALNRHFAERGQRLHIVSLAGSSIDTGTASGWFMLSNFALHAEFESLLKSERVRESRSRARAKGTHAGAGLPWFCKVVGCQNGKKWGAGGKMVFKSFVPSLYKELCELRAQGLNWGKIILHYKKTCQPTHVLWHIRPENLKTFLIFMHAWHDLGCPDINQLIVRDVVRDYKRKHSEND